MKERTYIFNHPHWEYVKGLVKLGAELEERILGATLDEWVANTSELEQMAESLRSIYKVFGEQSPLGIKQKWEHAEAKLKQARIDFYNPEYAMGAQR
ncbi:MAG: hypothetical protein Q7S56_00630 [Nanoarchaeota archaeon]|nr:hypothetical protein [Nanoarchaeota archaeon]